MYAAAGAAASECLKNMHTRRMSEMLYEGEAKQQGYSPNNRTKQAKHRTEQQRSECTAALSLFGSEELHCIRSVESRVNIFMNETHFSSGFVELDDDNDGSFVRFALLQAAGLAGRNAGSPAGRQANKQSSVSLSHWQREQSSD